MANVIRQKQTNWLGLLLFTVILASLCAGAQAQTNYYYTAPVVPPFPTTANATPTWEAVPGCSLSFTPGSAAENWLVIATGQVSSSSTSDPGTVEPADAAHVRLRVGGTVEGEGGVQNSPANAETGFFMMDLINSSALQNIDVQAQDPFGLQTTTVEDCSITAFLVPSNADFQWTEVPGASGNCLDAGSTGVLSHTLNPSGSAGDYLSIVSFVSIESPGGSTNKAWINYPIAATDAPDFNVDIADAWSNGRAPRQTLVSMRKETLPAISQALSLDCDGSGGVPPNSTILWAKAASFRVDAFDATYHDEDLAEVVISGVGSDTWVTRSTVTQTAPVASREFIMLGTISGCTNSGTAGPQHGMQFRKDSTVQGDSVWGVTRDCSYDNGLHNSFQWVEPYTTASAKTWDNQYQSTDDLTEARFAESAIHVLQFPAPANFANITTSAGLSGISQEYGVGWGDYNNDGYPDLYISLADALYMNDGDGTFSAGPVLTGNSRGAHWGDYDNDGDLDFFATQSELLTNTFSRNDPGPAFTLLDFGTVGISFVNNLGDVSWLDFDNDGDLDVFAHNAPASGNRIYSNDGDGSFTTLTPTGLNTTSGNGEVTGVADYDGDGDTDILFRIAGTARLYKNNGNDTFTEVVSFAIADDNGGYNGMAFGDYDGDGDLDLYLAGSGANKLFRNDGGDVFTDRTAAAGVAGPAASTRGVAWGDFDNDGDLDLLAANQDGTTSLFENNGSGVFTDVGGASGLNDGIIETGRSAGAMWADYDLDGDLDLFVGRSGGLSKFYGNILDDTNYLKVKVTGAGAGYSPIDGTGARVELYDSTGVTLHAVREIFGGEGFGSHSSRIAHFGLASGWGGGSGTYMVKVNFTSGRTLTKSNVVPTSESITIGATPLSNTVEIFEEPDHMVVTATDGLAFTGGTEVLTIQLVDELGNPVSHALAVTVTVDGSATFSANDIGGTNGTGTLNGTLSASGSGSVTITDGTVETVTVSADSTDDGQVVANVDDTVVFSLPPPPDLQQLHYRWRNDNGIENGIIPVESRVNLSTDDAEEHADFVMESITSSDLEMVWETSDRQQVGMRFQSVNVPEGATITRAYIEFDPDETHSMTTTLTFEGQLSLDPATFDDTPITSDGNISTRNPRTTAVLWSNVPPWDTNDNVKHQTPNLSVIIDEIVNQPGWDGSLKSLVIIVTGNDNEKRVAKSFDGDAPNAPLLHVEYDTGNGATFAANEDTILTGLATDTTRRLRFLISNEGIGAATGTLYQLQVSGPSPDSCVAASYLPVDSSTHWTMATSIHFTDGDPTENIAHGGTPDLTDPGGKTFVAGELNQGEDTTNSGINLSITQFTEIEYAVQAIGGSAAPGALYCFRLTDNGDATDFTYSEDEYGQVTLATGATSAAVTGNITPSATEAEIVSGSKTIVLTLTGDTWVPAGAGAGEFDTIRQNIIDGLNAGVGETNGWDNEVQAKQGVAGVVRTSTTVVTITLDAQAAYNIAGNETITVTVPAAAVNGGGPIGATPTFDVIASGGGSPDLQQVHYRWRNDNGGEGWYNPAWTYRKKITIDNAQVDANLTQFPVYVDLSDLSADFFANVESAGGDDGGDIRVTTSNGTTELPREVVSINVGTLTGELHFEADFLSSSAPTDFYIYYGNAAASEPAASATYGSDNVWANGYAGLWHLGEEQAGATGTADVYADSTGNPNGGDDYVSATGQGGQIPAGQEFDGLADYVDAGTDTSLDMGSGDFTLSAWIQTMATDSPVIAGKGGDGALGTRYLLRVGSAGELRVIIDDEPNKVELVSAVTGYNDGFWHHVVGVRDGTNLRLYVDGTADVNSPSDITGIGSLDSPRVFSIGSIIDEPTVLQSRFFGGLIDEVRVSNVVRTAGWIGTEHNNQLNPGTGVGGFLASIGSQEAQWFDTAWSYRKKITIDNTKVDADQTDFPVYVDLADLGADFHSNLADANGGDIRVTDSDGLTELPRQVVVIDTGANTGELHFEANFLSSTVNTDFYIYYGNAAASEPLASSPYGSDEVWANNYVGVWHLHNDFLDSSFPNNNGTNSGSTNTGGKIGDGSDFLASNTAGVDVLDSATLDLNSTVTVSVWFNPNVVPPATTYQRLVVKSTPTNASPYTMYGLLFDNASHLRAEVASGGLQNSIEGTTLVQAGIWQYGTMTYDGTDLKLYWNGGEDATPTTFSSSIDVNDEPLTMGKAGFDSQYLDGKLDEARVSSVARPAEWISTEYNNQDSPGVGGFLASIDSQESASGGGATWAADEDTILTGLAKTTTKRLRIEVSNQGTASSGSVLYRLEVSQANPGSCDAGGNTWTRVNASSEWDMALSTHFADGDATQDINPGLTNANTTFVDGELKESTDEVNTGITLSTTEFTEIEYAVQATGSAVDGALYCFRLVDGEISPATIGYTEGTYGQVTLATGATSAAVTGTITPSATEAEIVSGAKEIVITLSGDTWVPAGASAGEFDTIRQNIIDGLNAGGGETNGWDPEVRAKQGVAGVVRTSTTVVTITLDAQAAYDIAGNETITVTVPAAALNGGSLIVATPTFDVTASGGGGGDATVTTTGTQSTSMAIPSTDQYVGGAFVITENTSSRNVTGITITEKGTVDALNDLSNVRLYYETSADCSTESFSGFPTPTETLFGSATTFDAVDGSASFAGSVAISTGSAMCVYVVLDVGSATDGQTLEIEITDPSTEVTVDGAGTVGPGSAVALSGTTTLNIAPLEQVHYRWRNDDGPESAAGWYDASWNFRKKITVDFTKVDADQSNFPVYVDLADLSTDFFANVESAGGDDGGDIRVTQSDGVTELPREVVAIDTGAETGELHFEANSLSSTVPTDFYIYYGNAAASEPARSSTYGKDNVWANGYVGAWHLEESPANATAGHDDSTGNPNDGTPQNFGGAGSTTNATGKIGGADDLDGVDDYINVGSDAVLDDLGPLTISAWIMPDTYGASGAPSIATKRDLASNAGRWLFEVDNTTPEVNTIAFVKDHVTTGLDVPSANSVLQITPVAWQHVVATWDGSINASGVLLYVDGGETLYGATISAVGAPVTDAAIDLSFGARTDGSSALHSTMDEIRISSSVRLASWIKTEFNNQDDPGVGGFLTSIGSQETPSAGGTWAANEDTELTGLLKLTTKRLRIEISNASTASGSVLYRLEVSQANPGTCDGATYTRVDTSSEWNMVTSIHFADGDPTSNISSGLTDPGGAAFVAGELKESDDETSGITLGTEFTEIEYALTATNAAIGGGTYCFRLTDAGIDAEFTYSETKYGKVTLGADLLFGFRKSITIDELKFSPSCTGTLTDFPLLFKVQDPKLATTANGGEVTDAEGDDIIFRAFGTATCAPSSAPCGLDHQIEKYDPTTGELIAWVRIPTLSMVSDTEIFIYYGNTDVVTSTQNAAAVWDSNYVGVWHLEETVADEGTVADKHIDSAGTKHGDQNGNASTPGKIAGGQDFDTNDSVDMGDEPEFDLSAYSWSMWINSSAAPGSATNEQVIYNADSQFQFNWSQGNASFQQAAAHEDSVAWQPAQIATPLLGSAWYHIAATYDGSNIRVYLNGSLEDTQPAAIPVSAVGPLTIGDTNSTTWSGQMDEVRISDTDRNGCFFEGQYKNQDDPGDWDTPGFYDVGTEDPSPLTFADVTTFTAEMGSEGGVRLHWRTTDEVNNLGFHVYREENGQRVRVTPEMVAGSALFAGAGTRLTSGHSYGWWDRQGRTTDQYWLEDVDLDGTRSWSGPVSPSAGSQQQGSQGGVQLLSSPLLSQLPRGEPLKTVLLTSGPQQPQAATALGLPELPQQLTLAASQAVKLEIRETGWYRVAQPELVSAGLDAGVKPRYLQLFVQGQQQALVVRGESDGSFDAGDAIEFYGQGVDTSWTDAQVYWLVEGAELGLRAPALMPTWAATPEPTSFSYTLEQRERTIYVAALRNGEEENFYGPVVTATPVDQVIDVHHWDGVQDAQLEVTLQGLLDDAHQVKVLFNGVELGVASYFAWENDTTSFTVSAADLVEGDNTVTMVAEGGASDISLIDVIRLTYSHTYTVASDSLEFTVEGQGALGQPLTIDGFSNALIQVADVTDPMYTQLLDVVVQQEAVGYSITVGVPGAGTRTLLALTEDQIKSPAAVVANGVSSWHEDAGAEVVMIAYGDFVSSVEPLKALRESQGYSVALVAVEDLYDEFAFGAKTPWALRDFLEKAKSDWQTPPRFVVLVGDASSDPRDYMAFGQSDFVPTWMVETALLETASDDWFVDFDSDGVPDLAIGRLPVRTVPETDAAIAKILAYEADPGGAWQKQALMVADENDAQIDFEGITSTLKALMPNDWTVEEILKGQSGAATNAELLTKLNEGQQLVNYMGHGSTEIWGDLLSSSDIASLSNGAKLPFFVSLTCLNGFFHDIYTESLAESLIRSEQGGAIAVWASSALNSSPGQLQMAQELYRLLFDEGLALGEAAAQAKAVVSDLDVRRSWIFFGDPVIRFGTSAAAQEGSSGGGSGEEGSGEGGTPVKAAPQAEVVVLPVVVVGPPAAAAAAAAVELIVLRQQPMTMRAPSRTSPSPSTF